MSEKKVLLKDLFEEAISNQKINRSKARREQIKERDTGFLNTRKVYCQPCKKKYTYRYKYFDRKQNKDRVISCVNFLGLRDKIKSKGLKWEIDSYYQARKTAKEVGLPLRDLK